MQPSIGVAIGLSVNEWNWKWMNEWMKGQKTLDETQEESVVSEWEWKWMNEKGFDICTWH